MKLILLMMTLIYSINCYADSLYPFSLDRIINDSDIIIYGHSLSQKKIKSSFKFIDFDGEKKSLDVFFTKFNVIKYFKGNGEKQIDVCIPNILGYDNFAINKEYIVFLFKTRKGYIPIHGITGMVEVNGQKLEHFFRTEESYFENYSSLEKRILFSVKRKLFLRKITEPYQRYEQIISNPCW